MIEFVGGGGGGGERLLSTTQNLMKCVSVSVYVRVCVYVCVCVCEIISRPLIGQKSGTSRDVARRRTT